MKIKIQLQFRIFKKVQRKISVQQTSGSAKQVKQMWTKIKKNQKHFKNELRNSDVTIITPNEGIPNK